jgi:hypothetical protein
LPKLHPFIPKDKKKPVIVNQKLIKVAEQAASMDAFDFFGGCPNENEEMRENLPSNT